MSDGTQQEKLELIVVICPWCHRESDIYVPASGLAKYNAGVEVKKAFPHLNASQKELFITGICDTCWQNMPKEDD